MPMDMLLPQKIGSDLISEAYVDVSEAYEGGDMLLVLLDGLRLLLLLMVSVVATGVVGAADCRVTELTLFSELKVGSCLIESSLRMWWSSWKASAAKDAEGEVEDTARLAAGLLRPAWVPSWT